MRRFIFPAGRHARHGATRLRAAASIFGLTAHEGDSNDPTPTLLCTCDACYKPTVRVFHRGPNVVARCESCGATSFAAPTALHYGQPMANHPANVSVPNRQPLRLDTRAFDLHYDRVDFGQYSAIR